METAAILAKLVEIEWRLMAIEEKLKKLVSAQEEKTATLLEYLGRLDGSNQ